jgi:hypothetical protein
MTQDKSAKTIDKHTLVTGAEFKDFYKHHWPKQWYVEDMYIAFEDDRGNFCLDLEAKYKLDDFGWAGWQGKGDPKDGRHSKPIWEIYIEKMSEGGQEVLVAFKIPEAKSKELVEMAKSLGARLI